MLNESHKDPLYISFNGIYHLFNANYLHLIVFVNSKIDTLPVYIEYVF